MVNSAVSIGGCLLVCLVSQTLCVFYPQCMAASGVKVLSWYQPSAVQGEDVRIDPQLCYLGNSWVDRVK